MSVIEAAPPVFASRAARVTLALACLFATTGVVMVFLPRWLETERGLVGAEIGAVLSLAQLARIATGPALALWADSVADRRTPIRVITLGAFAAFIAFFAVAREFWGLLVFGFVALSLYQGLTPLMEATTLRATAQGKFNYGFARGAGSIAFIFANVAGGAMVASMGVGVVPVWVFCGLAAMTLAVLFVLAPDPAPAAPQPRPKNGANRLAAVTDLLRSRRYLILILACGLIQSAHAFYYGFSTLVWRGQGLTPGAVGLLWGFGVAVEVGFLMFLAPIERRVRPETMIVVGAAGAVVRWLLMGFAPVGLLLWPLQGLHALSFAATHVGAMRLIYREAPESAAGMAQTLYAALSAGLLMGLSTLFSGVLYDGVGARGYWVMSALALAGGALALLLLRPPTRAPVATPS